MYPLDVTVPHAGCCVAGGLEFRAGSIHGSISMWEDRPAPDRRLAAVCTPGALRLRSLVSSGGRVPILGRLIVSSIYFSWLAVVA